MIGTIDLYKLALTPNDTMYFDSVNAQTEWFNNQEHLSIDNISFNGDRAFRLGQNYLDVVFNYNYVRYKLNDRYIYAFIENVIYNNDNTSSLNISIDLNQTFLQELQTAISTSNVGNVTKKDSYFETYRPYDNKLTVPQYKVLHIGNMNPYIVNVNSFYYKSKYMLGHIMFNVPKLSNTSGDSPLIDNGYQTNIYCYVLPVLYDLNYNQLVYADFKLKYSTGTGEVITDILSSSQLNLILSEYGSYIEKGCIAINFEPLIAYDDFYYEGGDFYLVSPYNPLQPAVSRDADMFKLATFENFTDVKQIINITVNNEIKYHEYDLTPLLNQIPLPIRRQPYLYFRIGNDKEHILLNLLDFENVDNSNKLVIESFTSCMYPFTTNFKFIFNGGTYYERNALFNLVTTTPIPYTLSAWQEYYARNSASVNDGLATQQKYEREISRNNLDITKRTIGVEKDIAIGTALTSGLVSAYTGSPSGVVSSINTIFASNKRATNQIANAEVQYANSELQRQKEKALLDIQWNDIKSSPSEYSNTMSGLTSLYRNGIQNIEIDLYIATNIEDIIKYHKYYGYKVNRMEKLTWQDIKQHTVFDYISFNTITLKSTLPQFYTAMIEQQYEQGVRFWYDYNNFMNYEIENEEVQ